MSHLASAAKSHSHSAEASLAEWRDHEQWRNSTQLNVSVLPDFSSSSGDVNHFIMDQRNHSFSVMYDYEYDYNASLANIPLKELVPVTIVYGLTFILGLIGNVLVIVSITRYRRMQTVTNTFLTSLASADLLLVSLCIPVKVSFKLVLLSATSLNGCAMKHAK